MKIKVFFFLFLIYSFCFSQNEAEIRVRAVSESFINLCISIPDLNITTIASGSLKGYRENKIVIPCKKEKTGEKIKINFLYHITQAGEWIGREKGEFEVNFDPDKFPYKLILLSQKGKDISRYQFFIFSLDKIFFKTGEKGYLKIYKRDKLNVPDSGFACFLKNILPFSSNSQWIKIPLKQGADGIYSFTIPSLLNGVYKMKIVYGGKDKLNLNTTPYGDFLIGISSFDPNISIFTDRNRTIFLQGEKVEINVFLKGTDLFNAKVKFFLDNNFLKEFNISSDKISTFSFALETSKIFPGKHILKAVLTSGAEANYPLTIVSPVLSTHLVILDYHFFSSLLRPLPYGISLTTIIKNESDYVNTITEGGGSYEFLDELYHKRDGGDIFKKDRYTGIKKFIKKYPLYLPEERTYNPDRREQIFQLLLKYHVSHLLRPSFVRYLAHSIPEDENRRYRHIQIMAQSFKNYPSFAGINYHDDSYPLGYGETGWMDGRRKKRMEVLEEKFKKKYGKTSEEDRNKWIDFVNQIFPEIYKRYQTALKQVDKNLLGTSQEVPDAGVSDGFYIPNVYKNLDAVTYLSYSDHVGFPLQEAFQAALYRAGLREKDIYSTQNGDLPTSFRYEAMLQVSGITEGMGFMDINGQMNIYDREDNSTLSNGGDHYHISYSMRPVRKTISNLYKIYGDFFLELKRDEKIAILFSYTQAATEQQGSATDHKYTVFEAYSDFLRAHFPADIITEDEISEGKFYNYKVIILPGIKVQLPEKVKKGLKKFQKRGGVIFASSDSCLQIDGVKKLPFSFSSYGIHWGGYDGNLEYKLFYDVAVKKAPVIKKLISPYVEEKFISDNPRIMLFTRKRGKAIYLFATHDTPPAFDWGLPQNVDAERIWNDPKLKNQYRKYTREFSGSDRLYQNWVIPLEEEIKVNGFENYICYDVLKGEKVSIKNSLLKLDFRKFEGNIYAFLPSEISNVSISISTSPSAYKVELLDKKGEKIEAPVPVEVLVKNKEGKVLYHLFRSSPLSEKIFLNDGEYTIKVRELFSGLFTEKTFVINRTAIPEMKKLKDVTLFNGDDIEKFLKEKKEIIIYIDEKQKKDVLALAEKIKNSLPGRLKIKYITQDKIKEIPLKWKYNNQELELKEKIKEGEIIGKKKIVRNVKIGYPDPLPSYIINKNLLLLGTPGKNRLIEDIFKSGISPRLCSENYPGKGKGIVFYIFSPFYAHRDCICLFGSDKTGLEKTVEKFILFIRENNFPSDITSPPRLFLNHRFNTIPENLTFYKKEGETGKERFSFIENFTPGYTDSNIYTIACSENGKNIVIGTDAFGYNLFYLDNSGKVIWKGKARDILCQNVGISKNLIAAGIIHSDKRSAENSVYIYNKNGKFLWKEAGFIRNALDQFVLFNGGIIINKGKYIVYFDKNHNEIWKYTPNLKENEKIRRISISKNGKYIVAGCWAEGDFFKQDVAHSIRLIEVATGKEIWEKATGSTTVPFAVNISESGDLIVTGSYEGSISIFNKEGRKTFYIQLLPEAKPDEPLKNFIPSGIFDLKISQDEKYILVKRCAFDFNAYIVNIETGKIINLPADDLISGIDILKSDSFAVSSYDKKVRVFDRKGNLLWSKKIDGASKIKFGTDGNLYAGTVNGFLYCFDKGGNLLWKKDLGKDSYIPDLNKFLIKNNKRE